jgi:hypothetical protein
VRLPRAALTVLAVPADLEITAIAGIAGITVIALIASIVATFAQHPELVREGTTLENNCIACLLSPELYEIYTKRHLFWSLL